MGLPISLVPHCPEGCPDVPHVTAISLPMKTEARV